MESVTKGQLYEWSKEIKSLNGSIFSILMRGRIKDFLSNNGLRINNIEEWVNNMFDESYEKNEDGTFKFDEKTNLPFFKEGKTKEQYDEIWKDYMSQTVSVLI